MQATLGGLWGAARISGASLNGGEYIAVPTSCRL